MDNNAIFLLPHRFKLFGVSLFVIGIVFGVIRFYYGIKLSFLDFKWFAIYSNYLQIKTFVFTENNFGEEVPSLLILLGLVLVCNSKEKDENDSVRSDRVKAVFIAIYLNVLLLVGSILFVFGIAFVEALMLNMFAFWIFYYLAFKYFRLRKYLEEKRTIES